MTKTVTSLFHNEQHAAAAASHLAQAGIPRDAIDIWSTPHNLAPLLEDAGVSRSDAYAYVEGVLRGGSVVIVSCADTKVDEAVRILDQEGVLDLDEQQTSWHSEGWQEHQVEGLVGTREETDLTGSSDTPQADTNITTFGRPEEVRHGRVRVHSRNVERPVQK